MINGHELQQKNGICTGFLSVVSRRVQAAEFAGLSRVKANRRRYLSRITARCPETGTEMLLRKSHGYNSLFYFSRICFDFGCICENTAGLLLKKSENELTQNCRDGIILETKYLKTEEGRYGHVGQSTRFLFLLCGGAKCVFCQMPQLRARDTYDKTGTAVSESVDARRNALCTG